MKALFDVEGPLYKFMSTLTNIFVLNLCFVIGALPIVTIGVSAIAACDVGLRMAADEEGYIVKQYIKAYKSNFKQGLPLGIITLVAYYALYLYLQIIIVTEDISVFLIIAGMLAIVFLIACTIYTFPLLARYENTIPKTMKNSFHIFTRYPGRSLLLLCCLIIEVVAFLWNIMMWFVGAILGFASIILTICLIVKPIFDKLEKLQNDGEVN